MYLWALLGVLIKQGMQLLQLYFAETQYRPGRIACQQIRSFQQRPEQVCRTQVFTAIQRRPQPGTFDEPVQLAAQLRLVLHAARQRIEMVKQAPPKRIHVPFMTARDEGQVALAVFQQLEQPVFDADPPMGPALTQRSRRTERLGAVRIEAAKQARGVVCHEGMSWCWRFSVGSVVAMERGRDGLG
ncbi:hypothetical protein D3C81_1714360 [compost metagenome]